MAKGIRVFGYMPGVLFMFIAVMAGAALLGCGNPWDPEGGVQITLDLGRISGGARNARGVADSSDYYTVGLDGPGGSQTHRVERANPVLTLRLIAGTWTIGVSAYNSAEERLGSGAASLEVGPDKDNRVTIVLIPEVWTITYHLNDGVNPLTPDRTTYNIETPEITLPIPTRQNYEFAGWYRDDKFSGSPVKTIPRGSTGNREFWAQWVQGTGGITISFTAPGDEAFNLIGGSDLSWVANTPLSISAPAGYDGYQWYLDGEELDGATGSVLSKTAKNFIIATHNITLRVKKGSLYYSKEVTFKVDP